MIVISATLVTDDPHHAARGADVLARAAVGLALDGVSVGLSINVVDDDDGDDGGGEPDAPDGDNDPCGWFERVREASERMPPLTMTGLPILP